MRKLIALAVATAVLSGPAAAHGYQSPPGGESPAIVKTLAAAPTATPALSVTSKWGNWTNIYLNRAESFALAYGHSATLNRIISVIPMPARLGVKALIWASQATFRYWYGQGKCIWIMFHRWIPLPGITSYTGRDCY